ncbi:MAG: hypothetical protein Q9160_008540 [Pyrenula sp. 1 TL-2023]
MPSQNDLPASYAALPLQQLRLSHHPSTSHTPTPIVIITLHRPSNNNAFTELMASELVHVYSLLSIDPRVKAIVLRGHGDRIFCAGADLDIGLNGGKGKVKSSVTRGEEESIGTQSGEKDGSAVGSVKPERDSEHRDGGGRVALAIHNCSKPTLCALTGSAVGVGITLTLPCAIRIASSRAKIGFVFARRGIVMEAASCYFLPRLIGLSQATHLVTTGAVYPASHRLLDVLFSEIVEGGAEETMKRTLQIAEEVAEQTSVVSTKLMREMMWRGPDSAEEAHLLTSRVIHGLFGSRDNEEGVGSFLEKRKPDLSGTMEEDAPAVWPWWMSVDVRNEIEKLGPNLLSKAEGGKGKAKL